MEVLFKYKVGQKVTLTSSHLRNWQYRDAEFEKFVGREVTIRDRGFRVEEVIGNWQKPNYMDKYHIDIVYYIEEDIVFIPDRNGSDELTRIPEDCLEGENQYDEETIRVFTNDGRVVELGDRVYADIVNNYNKVRQANTRFTFASYGRITGISKSWERHNNIWDKDKLHEEIQIEREFLGYLPPDAKNPEPRLRQDSAAIGNRSWWNVQYKHIYVKPPKDFAKLYVETALSDEFGGMREYPFDNWEICQWLNHMGLLEKTKILYDEKAPKIKEANDTKKEKEKEFEQKAKDMLSKLSPEERQKLKALL